MSTVLYHLTNPFIWKSKYLNTMSLEEFIKLEPREQVNLISFSFSNFLKFGVGVSPKDEQLASFIFEIDEALETNERTAISVRSGHGTGKTFILANLANFIGLTEEDAKLVLTAPVAAQLENQLMPEVKKWADNLFPLIRPLADVKAKHATYGVTKKNKAVARTARKNNSEALAGVHGSFVLYIIDEASGVDNKIFEVIEGALTGDRYLLVMCSNPTRTVGRFYETHTNPKMINHYRRVHLDCEKSANVKPKWVEDMKEKYGEDSDTYRVRVKGKFPKSQTDALFNPDMLADFFNDKRIIDDNGLNIWGNDIARYGDDKTQLYKRKGYRGIGFIGWSKLDTMETASKVTSEYNVSYEKPDYINVDTNGLGVGVYDRLNQIGLRGIVQDCNSNYKSTKNEYLNKRTEMYHNLADAIKKGAYTPYDAQLEEELLAITYQITDNGKIKLVAKQEIKDALGRSPDKSDAVALSYFENYPPKKIVSNEEMAQKYQSVEVPQGAW